MKKTRENSAFASLADVPRPTVEVAGWPAKVAANSDTIRCAILTAEMRNDRGGFAQDAVDVFVVRADDRTLQAVHTRDGWTLSISDDGTTINREAARHGSKFDRPVTKSKLARMFAARERFSWQEAEEVMRQFLSCATYPATVSWVGEEGVLK